MKLEDIELKFCHKESGFIAQSWYKTKGTTLEYHREDGPALTTSNGNEYYFINGKRMEEWEHEEYVRNNN